MITAKTRAQMQLDSNQGRARRAKAEHARALQERADQIASLRALRVARDAGNDQRTGNANESQAATGGTATPG